MKRDFFPQRPIVTPTIYAYKLIGVTTHEGYLKIGYTGRTAKERIEEQLHTSKVHYKNHVERVCNDNFRLVLYR